MVNFTMKKTLTHLFIHKILALVDILFLYDGCVSEDYPCSHYKATAIITSRLKLANCFIAETQNYGAFAKTNEKKSLLFDQGIKTTGII